MGWTPPKCGVAFVSLQYIYIYTHIYIYTYIYIHLQQKTGWGDLLVRNVRSHTRVVTLTYGPGMCVCVCGSSDSKEFFARNGVGPHSAGLGDPDEETQQSIRNSKRTGRAWADVSAAGMPVSFFRPSGYVCEGTVSDQV